MRLEGWQRLRACGMVRDARLRSISAFARVFDALCRRAPHRGRSCIRGRRRPPGLVAMLHGGGVMDEFLRGGDTGSRRRRQFPRHAIYRRVGGSGQRRYRAAVRRERRPRPAVRQFRPRRGRHGGCTVIETRRALSRRIEQLPGARPQVSFAFDRLPSSGPESQVSTAEVEPLIRPALARLTERRLRGRVGRQAGKRAHPGAAVWP